MAGNCAMGREKNALVENNVSPKSACIVMRREGWREQTPSPIIWPQQTLQLHFLCAACGSKIQEPWSRAHGSSEKLCALVGQEVIYALAVYTLKSNIMLVSLKQ